MLKTRTIAEPLEPPNMKRRYVKPGTGGGAGTEDDPFNGLATAQEHAAPGDLFILRAGTYDGTFTATKSGIPGKPVIWRGDGKGEAIIDGKSTAEKPVSCGIYAGDIHDVWF